MSNRNYLTLDEIRTLTAIVSGQIDREEEHIAVEEYKLCNSLPYKGVWDEDGWIGKGRAVEMIIFAKWQVLKELQDLLAKLQDMETLAEAEEGEKR